MSVFGTESARSTSSFDKRNATTFCYKDNQEENEFPPCPRVRPEAESNYIKNRGTMKSIFDSDKNKDYSSPRPEPRCPTDLSKSINERHHGIMRKWLNSDENKNYYSARPAPRCPTEATKEIAKKNQGTMGGILSTPEYFAPPIQHARVPRVKQEASDIAEHSTGKAAKSLFMDYGNLPRSARPAPRVKPEAEDFAVKNKGSVDKLFMGALPRSSRPQPRVKPEASGYATKGTVGSTWKLLNPSLQTQRPATANEPSQAYELRNRSHII